jgi:hypothetical protein
MSTAPTNGAPTPAPSVQPVQHRAYYMQPDLTADEAASLTGAGLNPEGFVAIVCPSAMPPQPAQPMQPLAVTEPGTDRVIGHAIMFLVPVVLPYEVPKVASAIMGTDGKPISSITMDGPPFALTRVIMPRKHLTEAAKKELEHVVRSHVLMGLTHPG